MNLEFIVSMSLVSSQRLPGLNRFIYLFEEIQSGRNLYFKVCPQRFRTSNHALSYQEFANDEIDQDLAYRSYLFNDSEKAIERFHKRSVKDFDKLIIDVNQHATENNLQLIKDHSGDHPDLFRDNLLDRYISRTSVKQAIIDILNQDGFNPISIAVIVDSQVFGSRYTSYENLCKSEIDRIEKDKKAVTNIPKHVPQLIQGLSGVW